ncbi:MAG: hypothetical protein HKP30_06795 [Myxococcales bacterium]|nr:hypothetical protein [Myxococcales bacterium]
MARKVTIRRNMLMSLGLLMLALCVAILSITILTARQIVQGTSARLISRALDRSTAELVGFFDPVERNLAIAGSWVEEGTLAPDDSDRLEALFRPMLATYPLMSSVNIGDADGRNWMLLRQEEGWLTRRVDPTTTGPDQFYREWDGSGGAPREWRVEDPAPEDRYDPRERAWYQAATEGAAAGDEASGARPVYWTDPYLFFTTREPGITAAANAETPDGRRFVIAVDVLLRDISAFTQALDVSENGFVAILTEDRRLVGLPGHPDLGDPAARAAALLKRPRDLGIDVFEDAVAVRDAQFEPEVPRSGRAGLFSFESGGETWWADAEVVTVPHDRRFLVVVTIPERDLLGAVRSLQRNVFLATALALVAAIASAFQLARRYTGPLSALARNSSRIRRLDLRGSAPVASRITEISELATAQEGMRTALDAFSRYVPTDVVRELLEMGEAAQIGGERKTLTVLFSDIQGFTQIAERKSPEELTHHLAAYFEEMISIIDEVGTVDKLIGDGIMAFWGAPYPDPHHARHAVEAVLACRDRLDELNTRWQGEGEPPLPTRFGLASGPALVGNVGAVRRLSYTAVGDVVNLASRLEGLNRVYGTQILAAEPVPELAGPAFAWRRIDRVRVVGRTQAVDISELLGRSAEVDAGTLAFARGYEQALALYRTGAWSEASALLAGLAPERRADASVRQLHSVCARLTESPPDPGWEPVTVLDHK